MIMKTIYLFAFCVLIAGPLWAQFKPDDKGSTIQFSIKNFGFSTGGSFGGLQGSIDFNSQDPSKATIDVSIDAKSINTGNDTRDDHLRQETYFDAKTYPRIGIVSTKITGSAGNGTLVFVGKLTIKNHTKDISFPFTAEPKGNGYLFKGSFTINRKDFGVGGTSTISDNLEVQLSVLAVK
jgi:polyisoprenoid-binding protein YceI